ncbi:xanthine dehydrogenase family protein molybdopterin-binding subunit [Thermodesulfobacteriota bacterium]
MMAGKRDKYSVIGKRQPRLDGPIKATGRAQFTDDVVRPGMLHGKIVRSSIARGRILNIDTSRAERVPGVKVVITGKDIDLKMASGEPLLSDDRVNYIGEEIAAVAAVDEDTAAEAAELIKVEYEPLKAVFSIEEAIADGAELIHQGRDDNYADKADTDYGDVNRAFSEAEHVRTGEYIIGPTHNCFAEHHAVVADYSMPGKLNVWTPNQSPLLVQMGMAGVLGLSESDVRVLGLHTGGAFSGRVGPRNHHFIAAILSRRSSRPVKIRCTADEEFLVYRGGGKQKISIKTGAMRDGTLKAVDVTIMLGCGAYMDPALRLFRKAGDFLNMFYRVEAARYRAEAVYTNDQPRGTHHGASFIGMKFAMGAELDLMAQDLGIDPVEIRLKNAFEKGDTTIADVHFASCGLKECIRKATRKAGWKRKYGKLSPYRGIGIGCGGANSGGKILFDHDTSAAFIKIGEDGKISLFTGLPDMGQGSHTAMAMIAAETLGILPDQITVISGDTDVEPFDVGAFGQRGTLVTGNAVKAACLDAKKQLAKTASKKFDLKPSGLIFRGGKVYPKGAPEKALSFGEVVHGTLHSHEGRYVMGKGFYNPPSPSGAARRLSASPAFSFGAQVAEVEVDPETGIVKLLKMTIAHDVGFAINPLAVEGQMDGQVFSGMGQTLYEERTEGKGLVLNPSFLYYKLPRPFEVPEMEHIIVETKDPYGPFGAKEVGEGPIMGTSPAIASAVSNAIGYPIKELPITPERVLRAIRQKSQEDRA